MNDEQLTQRMRAASEAVQMSDSTQAQHLEAISAALESAATPDADVISLAAASTTRRRRIVASVVAAAVMVPAGLAAASGCARERVPPPEGVLVVSQEQQASWVRNFNPLTTAGTSI